MSFWKSELGQLTGNADAAFSSGYVKIPNNTMAIAKIKKFHPHDDEHTGKYLAVQWEIVDGEFKGETVRQKIKVFADKPATRHRALNMLMLIYKMFGKVPEHDNCPDERELSVFLNKIAGIKIQETEPSEKGDTFNYVSEIHSSSGFKSETGVKLEPTAPVESAFSRNEERASTAELQDDIPW